MKVGWDALGAARAPRPLRGQLRVPGDKSISHRGLLLAAIAEGPSRLRGLLDGNDCRATAACLTSLGVSISPETQTTETQTTGTQTTETQTTIVEGRGLRGLRTPRRPLDCGRSGTTMRLLCGLLAGQTFSSRLTGDPQLLARPMTRVIEPLAAMGGRVESQAGQPPLVVHGSELRGHRHELALSSAQVKSALLIAGLLAEGPTTVIQPLASRDHTERLLATMGAEIDVSDHGGRVSIAPATSLRPLDLELPGDLSSAAFPLVAAALVPGSEVLIEAVGVNPSRSGLLDTLETMGVTLTLENRRERAGEPVADIRVAGPSARLRSVEVGGVTVVRMIDELPLLALAATQATGRTVIRDAAELRVKETDRIATTASGLAALGARVTPRPDGLVIEGPTPLHGGEVSSAGDHRLAMTLAVAGLIADTEVTVTPARCIADSFPDFVEQMQSLGAPLRGW